MEPNSYHNGKYLQLMNKCKTCGKNAEGEFCFQHKPHKKMKQIKFKTNGFDKEALDKACLEDTKKVFKTLTEKNYLEIFDGVDWRGSKKQIEHLQMIEMFTTIWKKRIHKSEISKEYLGKEALSIFFHHILPKEKYPQAMLDEENIILLTLDEHNNVENDMFKYEEINKRRIALREKYSL